MKKLSYSVLDVFEKCNYKYYLKYIEHIIPFIPIRYPLVTGSAFHTLIQEMYETCSFSKEFLKRNWRVHFLKELDREGSTFSSTRGYEEQLNYGYGLISQFYNFAETNGYLIKPLDIEWKFDIDYNGYVVTGRIDLIIKRNSVPFVEIIDYKTGWTKLTEADVQANKQLTIYDWAVKRLRQFDDTRVGILLPRKAQVILTQRTTEDHEKVLSELNNVSETLHKGVFEPNYNHCGSCELQKYCKYSKIVT